MKSVLLASLFLASVQGVWADEPVVATVDGVSISKALLEKTFQQNRFLVGTERVTKTKVLNDLINKVIGVKRAKANNLQNDPVVNEKVEDILYHAQISKDLEPKLNKIVVTDKEVETYYSSHPEFRTANILFRVRANPEKEEIEIAFKQAIKVYDRIKKEPVLFAELASKYSQSSSAPNGGDIGFQPAVNLAPEYFEKIAGKPPGFISPPVRTQFGFHIIKILAKKEFADINMEFYKKVVYNTKRDNILDDYFKGLRSKAKISINEQILNN